MSSSRSAPPSVLDSVLQVRYWLLAFLALGLVLAVFGDGLMGLLPGCTLYSATGLHCPGCGSTRAIRALAQGQLMQAMGYNLLFVLGLPVVLLGLLFPAAARWIAARFSPRTVLLVFGLILLFWIARNIGVYPMSWLAP